ncbi:hypothetical protein HQ520_03060 [bacterium]|nr:hypothetical protein [bacterium]
MDDFEPEMLVDKRVLGEVIINDQSYFALRSWAPAPQDPDDDEMVIQLLNPFDDPEPLLASGSAECPERTQKELFCVHSPSGNS